MKVLETQVYRGPNVYSLGPVIRMKIDLEDLEEKPSNLIDGFTDRLIEMIPSLYTHRCSEGVPGGFITRLREGTWAGHIIEHVALELQCLVGTEVGYGKTRTAERDGIYNLVFEYVEEKVGLEASRAAVRIVEHLAYDAPLDYQQELAALSRILDDVAYGPSTQSIIDKARARDIPFIRLNERNLVQLGHGKYQRRIEATVTSMTSLIATDIACDKELTKQMLNEAGIPVPRGRIVDSTDAAIAAAESIGYPVVLKPLNANHGKGVAINLNTREQVERAFERALDYADDVIVERYVEGRDHRVLVVNGEVVAVAERVPAHVIGDGRHSLQELIDTENKNPMRGQGHEKALTKIFINDESLRLINEQGLALDAVPAEGRQVWLKYTANISTGGTAVDRTDDIHYENIEIARRAARIIGLDIAGVDMLTTDIARPLADTNGAICEINAAPGFRMHVHPTVGQPRDVAGRVLDMIFPPGTPSRIPIVAITGTNGKTTTSRMLAHILKLAGRKVGLTTTDGLYIDGKRILEGDLTGPWSARMVLRDPTVDFAVLETARGGILRAGLGFDYCDVGVITNVSEDHLGMRGVETLEEMAYVKSVVIETVRRTGYAILNAEDPHLVSLAEKAGGSLCWFTLDPTNELVVKHTEAGGISVTLRDRQIIIRRGAQDVVISDVDLIPATFSGRAMFNVANAMVAALCAHLSGTSVEDIRTGLQTFETGFYLSPGRLNVEQVGDFHVLLDYAHNTAAYRNVAAFVKLLRVDRRVGVVAAPGDRRDVDILAMGEIAGAAFDLLIIKEDDDRRGRPVGQSATMMKRGAMNAGMAEEKIEIVPDEVEAVERGLRLAIKSDVVVITADNIKRTYEQITRFRDQLSLPSGV
ncbi:MAG: cyanophycin synthetase [Blastocatellia bacterium]